MSQTFDAPLLTPAVSQSEFDPFLGFKARLAVRPDVTTVS